MYFMCACNHINPVPTITNHAETTARTFMQHHIREYKLNCNLLNAVCYVFSCFLFIWFACLLFNACDMSKSHPAIKMDQLNIFQIIWNPLNSFGQVIAIEQDRFFLLNFFAFPNDFCCFSFRFAVLKIEFRIHFHENLSKWIAISQRQKFVQYLQNKHRSINCRNFENFHGNFDDLWNLHVPKIDFSSIYI